MASCKHCSKKIPKGKPHGLCYRCFMTPGVAALYPARNYRSREGNRNGPEPDPRPERQPGEPEYRCLWCFRYRCRGPMQRCDECNAEYHRMAGSMPAQGEGS